MCVQRINLRVMGKLYKTCSKTSNYVRGRDLGSEGSTSEEVECGANEDVEVDV